MKIKTMVVGRIDNVGDRLLLYEQPLRRFDRNEYRVIASTKVPVEIGDTIEYEPYGKNFGWFHIIVKVNKE